jgi:hypothetical protein
MNTIYKFTLPSHGVAEIEIPRHARLLSVQNQRGQITLWAAVTIPAPVEKRRFLIATTGNALHAAPADRFLGTVQLHNGDFVAHVFEVLS